MTTTPPPRATWYPVGVGVFAVGVTGWNLYRAAVLDLTHDEAITCLSFVAWGPGGIYDAAGYNANNHVLYSLLAWVSTGLFGMTELGLRLPAVLAGAFVVVAAGRLFRLLAGQTPLAFTGVLVVVLNPLVMDFLVAARGYGLGLGLSLWAWGSLIQALRGVGTGLRPVHEAGQVGDLSPRRPLISAGLAQGLAVGANLVFVYPNAALALAFLAIILFQNRGQFSRTAKRLAICYILPGAVTAVALSLPIFRHLGGEHFYYGTESLFAMAESIVEPTFPRLRHWARPLTIVALVGFVLLLVHLANLYRAPHADDFTKRVNTLFYAGTLGTLALLVLAHVAAGTPYPQDRTGIYLIPLVAACLVFAIAQTPRLSPVASFILLLVAASFLSQTQARYFDQWRYDAGTARVYRLLSERAAEQPGLTVGHDWRFEPTLNYYNWRADPRRFPRFDRRGPDGDYDLYYLEAATAEQWLQRGEYRVVYEDPVSKAFVVERDQP